MRIKYLLTVTVFTLLIAACGSKSEKEQVSDQKNLVDSYLAVKDALVATNASKAKAAATKFLEVNTNDQLTPDLQMIASNDDVAAQRKAFEGLSMKMYDMLRRRGSDTVLYKQYCPMAFNNKGAFWLAAEMEVNNPYFGDVMLHCGSVQEKIGG
ncbi:DUF3347 domain-containing protein [Roseivirga sp. E12]|uniref:DUF3347 domain-containing protein n=1 Tax=Roseivirga sp. E12 TaxID=2819237 RepID=UPI001ABC1DB0|nr:DUF3347 domain-containing protein [Roseivirga sp. E12]MBO3700732.1 DUF3347 domain-containing protein [Roseivirga sp. E12]